MHSGPREKPTDRPKQGDNWSECPRGRGTCEPTNYAQVASDPYWQLAMKAELDALQLNCTWTLVPLPPGHKPIDCKWVYKIKYN
ncbi:unnamed protein product [Prunus brigantina]